MSKKISELDLIDRLSGLEEFPARLDSVNYKIRITDVIGLVTKDRVGLGRVDNTGDSEKPVSTPQQLALDSKADRTDFNALSQAMANKANIGHTHTVGSVTGLSEALNGFNTAIDTLGNRVTVTEGYIVALSARVNGIIIPTTFDISAVNGLTSIIQDHSTRIDGKANVNHTHNASSILGLSNFVEIALAAKAYVQVGLNDW